jgi:hypothetical protein
LRLKKKKGTGTFLFNRPYLAFEPKIPYNNARFFDMGKVFKEGKRALLGAEKTY